MVITRRLLVAKWEWYAGSVRNVLDSTNEFASFHRHVKSRLFTYLANDACAINIVVEETDDDWGALVKECGGGRSLSDHRSLRLRPRSA